MSFLKKLILLLGIFWFSCYTKTFAQPNFVVIISDDMGWTGTSVAMSATESISKSGFYFTPNIDKIAKQGMTFSQGYAAAPKCSPSRCSYLTGQTTARNGFTETGGGATAGKKLISATNNREIDSGDITIAEWLKLTNQNYRTAHYGKWHLGANGPASHGFDFGDGNTSNSEGDNGGGAQADPKKVFDLTNKGIDFITAAKDDGVPFYLQISHWAVHTKIEAKQETIDLYNDPSQRPADPNNIHTNPEYAAMTEDMDTGIGLLLEKISELGLEENTYIVFMSDNGSSVGQSSSTPLTRGKSFLYEGGIRVPFMIKGPTIPADVYSTEPIVSYDLYPTIAALASATTPLPVDLDGADISPLFTGEELNRNEALYFHSPHYSNSNAKFPVSVAVDGNYKLRVNYETGAIELFDLANDIGETSDVSATFPEIRYELYVKLRNHLKAINGNMPSLNSTHADFSGTAPDVDSDGLNDEWEFRELLSYQFGADDDPDGDGISNLTEQTENTDPLVDNTTTGLFSIPIQAAKISLSPNPTKGIIYLSLLGIDQLETIESFQILNINGQLLKQGKLTSRILDINDYPEGTYFVKFQIESNWEMHKIIHQ